MTETSKETIIAAAMVKGSLTQWHIAGVGTLPTSCVTSGKSCNFSEPQYLHL